MPRYVTSSPGPTRTRIRAKKRRDRAAVVWVNPEWRTLANDRNHLQIARDIARRFAGYNRTIGDEYEAEAYAALVAAARWFRPDRATCPFPVYLGTVLRQHMIDLDWKMGSHGIRGLGWTIKRKRLRPEIHDLSWNTSLLAYPDPTNTDRADFEYLIHPLPPRCRCVLRWMYLEGWTRVEIAAWMGVSRTIVDRLYNRAMILLRDRTELVPH